MKETNQICKKSIGLGINVPLSFVTCANSRANLVHGRGLPSYMVSFRFGMGI